MPTDILIQDDDPQEITIPVGQDQADKLIAAWYELYTGDASATTTLVLDVNVPGTVVRDKV